MANFSFDIVSEVNFQEVDNAINQAKKELAQRYDFRNSKSSIDYNKAEKKITLIGDDEYKLKAVRDIVFGQMAKRSVSIKALVFKDPERAFEGTLRQLIEITSGISKDRAKELVAIIKDLKLKVQASIDGEKVRVAGPKKDELQMVIQHLRSIDFPIALSFTNYR